MAFKPTEITREHVLKGIEEIKKSKKPLTDGTRWEVIIDGKSYPPKEVMRFAREQFDGSKDWPKGGGWPTNEFLEKMGFEVKEKQMIEIISLGTKKIFKFSMGGFLKETKYRNLKIIERLENLNLIVMHENTSNGQGNLFTHKLRQGDYVYITYGKDKLGALCKIKSDIVELPQDLVDDINENGYKGREIEIVKSPLINNTIKLKTDKRAWLPSGYTTIYEVKNLKEANELLFEEYYGVTLVNDTFANNQKEFEKKAPMNHPLNQILYGPPGTGKTFELQNTQFDNFTIKETALTREQYLESVVADLTWWQVISIAVLDLGKTKVNDIVNHEFIKIKEKLSSSKTVRPTIWGQLQSHTIIECPFVNVSNRSEPLYFSKSEDSQWTIDDKLLDDYYPEGKNILAISKNYKPSNDTLIKNYDFVTFHQSFSYEDFVEGIKPRLDEGETDVAFEIKDGIFKKLCIKAEADPKNNYAIFIDEINRGNISAIFGELITLIEDDKRLGSTNELKVKLPYSKRELGVPSNLYIIGTMNTADRSVEALDTALRRRFSFSEIMPNPSLLEEIQFNGFNLAEVLKTINERIEVLLDRDHTIGHSYFLKIKNGDIESLKSVFKNNIFPLLQEYFYHDYEKIALILGEGFVRVKENQTVKFAKFNDINTPDIGTQFELIDKIEDIEGAVHLLLNRNV